jgi:hypothetical protein
VRQVVHGVVRLRELSSTNTIAVFVLRVPVYVVHKALQHDIGKDIVVTVGTLMIIVTSPYRVPGSKSEKVVSHSSCVGCGQGADLNPSFECVLTFLLADR